MVSKEILSEFIESFDGLTKYTLDIAPNTKPRMTAKDHFRSNHKKYWIYKESIEYLAIQEKLKSLPSFISFIIYYVPIPKNISKKNRELLEGMPVLKTPDIDNYQKALQDCLAKQDNRVHTVGMTKRYSSHPRIEIYVNKQSESKTKELIKFYKEIKLLSDGK